MPHVKHDVIPMKDFTGKRFGSLSVVKYLGTHKNKGIWLCACDCGRETQVITGDLTTGNTSSCGCIADANRTTNNKRRTHGMSKSREYAAYHAAMRRCSGAAYYPPHVRRRYFLRGIKFKFKSFEEFYAHVGPRPSPRHSLDRIDNDGHYEIGNVRWATPKEQNHNQSCRKSGAEIDRLKAEIKKLESQLAYLSKGAA